MFSHALSGATLGISGYRVQVETDIRLVSGRNMTDVPFTNSRR